MPDAAGNIKGIAVTRELPWQQTFALRQVVRVVVGENTGLTGRVVGVELGAHRKVAVWHADAQARFYTPGELRPA